MRYWKTVSPTQPKAFLMNFLRFVVCSVFALGVATPAFAQEPAPADSTRVAVPAVDAAPGAGDQQAAAQLPRPGQPLPTDIIAPTSSDIEGDGFFRTIGGDFKNFFRKDTAYTMGFASIAAVAAAPWDREGVNNGFNIPTTVFQAGNLMGSFMFQVGTGVATYSVGKAANNNKLSMVGRDIVRAQIVSQVIAQAVKFTVQRERPDGSNSQSFPSGHAASAFSTASVLNRHYGWKVGVPAYAFGSYVALARMAWNRHHATDVVMGAGLGIASARTVTMNIGGSKFNMGVQPQVGGASINFTKIYK
jgi:membrane-associated phospholipid phosphatase